MDVNCCAFKMMPNYQTEQINTKINWCRITQHGLLLQVAMFYTDISYISYISYIGHNQMSNLRAQAVESPHCHTYIHSQWKITMYTGPQCLCVYDKCFVLHKLYSVHNENAFLPNTSYKWHFILEPFFKKHTLSVPITHHFYAVSYYKHIRFTNIYMQTRDIEFFLYQLTVFLVFPF